MQDTLPPAGSVADAATADEHELPRGTAIDRYVVLERLGAGGMGVVYKAYDPDLDRGVALKLVRAHGHNPDQRQRLRARLTREAQALARLSHRNVVAVHDVGMFEDDVWVAMELVDGKTLEHVLAHDSPSTERIVELFVAAGRGLAAAHDVGIIHRDFKPSNVIVGNDEQVRVLDFGLARALVDHESQDGDAPRPLASPLVTQAGTVVGTPAYMPPEQQAGAKLDVRTDQFSFCVALCEALFGTRPTADVAELPGRSASGTRIPRRMRAALLRGLAAEPTARHPSMNALLSALALGTTRRAQWIAAGVAAAALASLAIVLAAGRTEDARACTGAEGRLAGIWDAPRKSAVREALTRHGDAVVAATVERLVDTYTAAWVQMHTSSCEATHVRHEQSAELLDLRTECLDRHLAEVNYLTAQLASADADIARGAVASVHALSPLDDCANTTALRDPIPPRDPATSRVLREELSRIRALFLVAKYREVVTAAAKLARDAEAGGDRWAQASALYLHARAQRGLGAAADAETDLYRAIEIAEAVRASDVVVDAWMTLAWIAGEDFGRYGDALRLAGVARGVLERMGGNPRLEASLEDHLGVLHLDRGSLVVARHHLERGLALRERNFGAEDSETAASLQHVAILEQASGNLDKALAMHRRARSITERELGPRHIDSLAMLGAEGATLYELGKYADANALLERGLVTVEEVTGAHSEMTSSFLLNLGLARWKLERFAEAKATFERARAIIEKSTPSAPRAASLYFNLTLLSLDTGAHDDASAYAARAAAVYERLHGPDHADVAQALEMQALADVRAGRSAAALPALERALAIRTKTASAPTDLAYTLRSREGARRDRRRQTPRARARRAGARRPRTRRPSRRCRRSRRVAQSVSALSRSRIDATVMRSFVSSAAASSAPSSRGPRNGARASSTYWR